MLSRQQNVGNRSVMAALDTGCACTSRPHWYAYALGKGHASHESVFTSLSFFPPSPFSFSLSFFHVTSPSSLSFLQLNTINYDLHLRIIQTLCLRSSCSTPLRKTLTANHHLRIEYFQHKIRRASSSVTALTPPSTLACKELVIHLRYLPHPYILGFSRETAILEWRLSNLL